MMFGSGTARHLVTHVPLIWKGDAVNWNSDPLLFRHLDSPIETRHMLQYLTEPCLIWCQFKIIQINFCLSLMDSELVSQCKIAFKRNEIKLKFVFDLPLFCLFWHARTREFNLSAAWHVSLVLVLVVVLHTGNEM